MIGEAGSGMVTRILLALSASVVLFQGAQGGPPAGAPGPWDNDVLIYRADKDGRVEPLATFSRAGVPTLARLGDGRLIAAHQHFPESDPAAFDKVAVRFSSDDCLTRDLRAVAKHWRKDVVPSNCSRSARTL